MALGTITKVADYTVSNKRYRLRDVQCTAGANYTTNGEAISATAVGLNVIENVSWEPYNPTQTRFFVWDRANGKLKVYTAFGTEAASNSDQSTFTVRMKFEGR